MVEKILGASIRVIYALEHNTTLEHNSVTNKLNHPR
jgi:hypothetical protein